MRSSAGARRVASSKAMLLAVVFLWITAFPARAPAAQTVKPHRVLALYWYGKDYPSNVEFDRGLQAAFQNTGIEYYAEYFEPNLFPGEGQAVVLRDYLRRKYSERKIDVLIAMSNVSADFLLKYRDDLFPDTPIVFQTVTRTQLRERTVGTGYPGVVSDNSHAQTMDLALRLHKSTKHVFVINGTIERDKWVETLFKEQFKALESKAEFTYLTDLSLGELVARVKGLPEQSLIFFGRQDYDEPGLSISMFEVLALIAASAKVPIYSTGAFVGYGTTGGYAIDNYECGVQAAGLALQIVNKAPLQRSEVIEVPSIPIFDWRQLRRWGIREADLPPGSEIRFRELTLFQRYRWRIIGFLTLCAVQSIFIAALLAERRKRQRARTELRERLEFETLLSELSADFATLPLGKIDQGIERWLTKLVTFLGAGSAKLFQRAQDGQSLDERNGRRHPDDSASGSQRPQQESVLAIPLHVNGSSWTLAFSALPSSRVWSADLPPRLRLAGEMLAGALVRKASAEALHQSQARYKLATVSGRVIVWDWDLETSNFYFDPFLKSLLGYEDQDIGQHFDDWLRLIHPEDVDLVSGRFHDHIHDGALRFEVEHRLLQKDGGIRWFLASGTAIENDQGERIRIVGTDTDITERKLAAQEIENLSTRLMDLQDQERRRIARELHDGTAQNLLLISLDLQALKLKFPGTLEEEFSECQALCEQSLQEIRTLSYVLHPPMLDEGGLLAALRWYLAGFSKRSGIDVDLVAQEIGRLPQAIEMDMFRIVQECLLNVHRHSGSRTALVKVERKTGQVILSVQDWGLGMQLQGRDVGAGPASFGVGLSGMRQRLRQFCGWLEVTSSDHGTTITATVPVTQENGVLCSSQGSTAQP